MWVWKCQCHYVQNPATCSCKIGKYLASIMDFSSITRDEVIESYGKGRKSIQTNFNETKATCKTQNFYILLTFLSITIYYWWLLVFILIWQNIEPNKNSYYHFFFSTNNELKENIKNYKLKI